MKTKPLKKSGVKQLPDTINSKYKLLMMEIFQMRFFGLLAEPSQKVTNKEMQSAYENFVEQVKTVGSSDDYLPKQVR